MNENFTEEVIRMLSPKIKSVLRQTTMQDRDDLEQELKLLIITKMSKGFNETPSFFEMLENIKKGS